MYFANYHFTVTITVVGYHAPKKVISSIRLLNIAEVLCINNIRGHACFSTKDISVAWYCSHNCDKSALRVGDQFRFYYIPVKDIALRVNWIILKYYFSYD